jgi:hypothetical protein
VLVAGLPHVLGNFHDILQQGKEVLELEQQGAGRGQQQQGGQEGKLVEGRQQQQEGGPQGVFMPAVMGLLLQGAALAQAASGGQPGAVWATYQTALPQAVQLLQLEEPLAQGAGAVEEMEEWLGAAMGVVGAGEGVAAGADVGPLVHRVLDALVPELTPVLGQQAGGGAPPAAADATTTTTTTTPSSSSSSRYAAGTLLGRLRLRGLVLGWHLAWSAAAAAWRRFEVASQGLSDPAEEFYEARAGSSSSSSSRSGSRSGSRTTSEEAAAESEAADSLVVQMVVLLQAAEGLLHASVQCHEGLCRGLMPLLGSAEARSYLHQVVAAETPAEPAASRSKAGRAAATPSPPPAAAAAAAESKVTELLAHLFDGTHPPDTVLQLLLDLMLPERGQMFQKVHGVATACLQPLLARVSGALKCPW